MPGYPPSGDASSGEWRIAVPGWALRVAVGDLADYLLQGRRVAPQALREHGFAFRHPELDEALRSLDDRGAETRPSSR